MPFSKSPQTSTYQTKEVKLLSEWLTRDSTSTKDNDTINCFHEVVKNREVGYGILDHHVVKRHGTVAYPYVPAGVVRGSYYWKDQDKLYVAYSTKIDVLVASTGVLSTTLTLFFTSSGPVGFCEFLYDDNTVKIITTDGSILFTIDSANTVVQSVDADMPTPHLPQPVFLDGYLFIVKTNTADIYNSNLNDPTAWTSGDFISAEIAPDKVSAVTNINNYIIVFGSSSIEYFFDAANASGSPLQRYDTPIKFTGYIGGLAKYGNRLLFVGKNYNTGPQVYVAEDLKIDPMGSTPVQLGIETTTTAVGSTVNYGGHDLYYLTANNLTYVYDLETKLWTRAKFQAGTNFSIMDSANFNITGVGTVCFFTLNNSATMYYFKATAYNDAGTNFTATVITENQMFDTYNNKFGARLAVIADRPSSNGTLDVSWTDDDYQSYSTARSVELNQEFPKLAQLGKFKRRAFKLEWTQNLPMRLKSLELDLNLGQA